MIFNARDGSCPRGIMGMEKMLRFGVAFLFVIGFAAVLWPSVEPVKLPLETASNVTLSSDVLCDIDHDQLANLNILKLAQYTRREIVLEMTDEPVPYTQWLDEPFLQVPKGTEGRQMGAQFPAQCPCGSPSHRNWRTLHTSILESRPVSRLNESLDAFAHWAGYSHSHFRIDRTGISRKPESTMSKPRRTVWGSISTSQSRKIIISTDTCAYPSSRGKRPRNHPMGLHHRRRHILHVDAQTVDALAKYDHTTSMYIGDRRIANCVFRYTKTRLTADHRLRQLDLMRDASGFFESLPLRKWYFGDGWIFDERVLGHWHHADPDKDDISMEQTWDPHNGANEESYLHELGPSAARMTARGAGSWWMPFTS
ncbi:hypothetical protein N7491_008325 [Penicillium cf. griseofulvum]|nr:hypothetical protein N7491_008325 [Penicillium cf. griseofulvum]